ncbi:MAG TPA: hypothetical protein VJH97_03840 [Candidatus Nanoarchaeia archaeon]|nr:hypothetical protein [Candidatus Nanoarchaeia archaeon]
MNTTISISKEIRDKIKEFGTKGETYTDILRKMYDSFCQRQIQELLMDTTGCIPIRDALRKAQKRWQK